MTTRGVVGLAVRFKGFDHGVKLERGGYPSAVGPALFTRAEQLGSVAALWAELDAGRRRYRGRYARRSRLHRAGFEWAYAIDPARNTVTVCRVDQIDGLVAPVDSVRFGDEVDWNAMALAVVGPQGSLRPGAPGYEDALARACGAR